MKDTELYYSVGPLLYCPANNQTILDSLIKEKFGLNYSLALCLEDTINDTSVQEAETLLISTLDCLYANTKSTTFYLPKIFIRVRNPQQIPSLLERLKGGRKLITGFIIPKFCPETADIYINTLLRVNQIYARQFYILPILESPTMVHLQSRYKLLYTLKDKLDKVKDIVLNIRVGGNDLCHIFGFRRRSNESIHSIKPISNIFSDIVTVFGQDYVISGPVWEYYSGEHWDTGLAKELQEDRLCGFIGKTVIHPRQIQLVNDAYKVSQKDYDDATAILNWDKNSNSLVHGSACHERMNEFKTHYNWAHTILMLANVYGITP